MKDFLTFVKNSSSVFLYYRYSSLVLLNVPQGQSLNNHLPLEYTMNNRENFFQKTILGSVYPSIYMEVIVPL